MALKCDAVGRGRQRSACADKDSLRQPFFCPRRWTTGASPYSAGIYSHALFGPRALWPTRSLAHAPPVGVTSVPKVKEDFNYKDRGAGIRHVHCRDCQRQYKRAYYERNLVAYKARAARTKRVSIERNQRFLAEYLKSHPCVDCGESDPYVLEFDHLRNKVASVSMMAMHACSLEKIMREIEKCEIRCANCHRRKTRKQFGWFKWEE